MWHRSFAGIAVNRFEKRDWSLNRKFCSATSQSENVMTILTISLTSKKFPALGLCSMWGKSQHRLQSLLIEEAAELCCCNTCISWVAAGLIEALLRCQSHQRTVQQGDHPLSVSGRWTSSNHGWHHLRILWKGFRTSCSSKGHKPSPSTIVASSSGPPGHKGNFTPIVHD